MAETTVPEDTGDALAASSDPGAPPAQEALSASWFRRTLRVSRAAAGAAARLGLSRVRRGAGEVDGVEAADKLVEALGELKGVAMKVGQIASYMDSAVPPAWRERLASLQHAAPPMAPHVVEEVVEAELGRPPTRAFARWEPQPFAAASIGQVHRAWLHDGRPVAVKVQYPGIDKAIAADLRNAPAVRFVGGAVFRGVNTREVVAEIRERLLEECDYELEARNQEAFRALWSGQPHIHVPAVVPSYSTRRVLTTEFVSGLHFADFVASAGQEARNRAGMAIFRFAFESIFGHCVFNCDPHPGNYLFSPEGDVTFLDFGCCRRFDPATVHVWKRMMKATLLDDRPAFEAAVIEAGFCPDPRRYDFDYHRELLCYLYRPWMVQRPFRYTKPYVAESWKVLLRQNRNLFRMNMPREIVFINRLQWGLNSILAELGAEADWSQFILPLLEDVEL